MAKDDRNTPSVPHQLRELLPETIRYAMTPVQEAYAGRAWNCDPAAVRIALGKAEIADVPHRFFVAACKGIVDAHKEANASAALRSRAVGGGGRAMRPVECRDCADSGYVILLRDVGAEALAGDAAPCHCRTGQQKQRRYGTVHYGRADFEPVIGPDPDDKGSLRAYIESEEGKRDIHLPALIALMKEPEPPATSALLKKPDPEK